MHKTISLFISICALTILCSAEVESATIYKKIEGSFLTNVAGSSETKPPHIRVIRSADGLDYALSEFERLKNRITHSRIKYLRKQLKRIDYKNRMIIWILSQPMDNYKIKLNSLKVNSQSGLIEVNVTYRHKIINYRIPPKKTIHYILTVVKRSDMPVILRAKKSKVKTKAQKPITVKGRLMDLNNGTELQLVPLKIRRGHKDSYFIRGPLEEELFNHVGKVMTLRGTVSRERDGPYDFELTVEKIISIKK